MSMKHSWKYTRHCILWRGVYRSLFSTLYHCQGQLNPSVQMPSSRFAKLFRSQTICNTKNTFIFHYISWSGAWTKIAPSHLPCSTRKYEASNIWSFQYTTVKLACAPSNTSPQVVHLSWSPPSSHRSEPSCQSRPSLPQSDNEWTIPIGALTQPRQSWLSLYHLYPFLIPTSHS